MHNITVILFQAQVSEVGGQMYTGGGQSCQTGSCPAPLSAAAADFFLANSTTLW
jgi:hypothetical protein